MTNSPLRRSSGRGAVLAPLLTLALTACGSPASPGAKPTTAAPSHTGSSTAHPAPTSTITPPTTPAPATTPPATSPPAATPSGASPWHGVLYYADSGDAGAFNALEKRTLFPTGKAKRLLLGNPEQGVGVVIGPGVHRLLMTSDERPDVGGDDFAAQPVMRLYHPDGKTYDDLGSGYDVALSPDGKRLAWTMPTKMRTCTIEEDDCTEPPVRIVIAPMSNLKQRQQWGPYDHVRGLGWIGNDRILAFKRHGATALFTPSTGRLQDLKLGGEVRDLDPNTGRVLVTDSTKRILRLVNLDGTAVWERRWTNDYVSAWWSPDGRTILATVIRPVPEQSTSTERLLLIDPNTRAERTVPNTGKLNGEKVWSTSGRLFGFRREPADGKGFEFVICPTDLRSSCRVVHRYEAGISVLTIAD